MFLLILRSAVWETCRESTLNSIMFLLILCYNFLTAKLWLALNSIMFLLILLGKCRFCRENTFKFHYVSINSLAPLEEHAYLDPLNSIMFLLIQLKGNRSRPYVITLNSIMFLLIQSNYFLPLFFSVNFKFHYVSINSIIPL